jgi:pimeloyl-ACP methyl ester carboxylesterase
MSAQLIPCFLGGWGSTAEIWNATLSHWAALRTPASPLPEPRLLSWADALCDWPHLLRSLAGLPGRCLLVGWSLGALLALRAAIELAAASQAREEGTAMAALVLVSPTPRLCQAEGYPGVPTKALSAMRLLLSRTPTLVLEEFARNCAAPDASDDVRHAYLHQARQFSTDQLAGGLKALAEIDVRSELTSIRVPCQILHGSEDNIVPLASVRFLAERLPQARLHVLEGCGHALPFTHPARIARCIAGAAEERAA